MKKLFFLVLLLSLFSVFLSCKKQVSQKNICLIIANKNFRDEEYSIISNIFNANGYKITVASTSLNAAEGFAGTVVNPDILIKKIIFNKYKALLILGGTGPATGSVIELEKNVDLHKILTKADKKHIIIGAIGYGPNVLAVAGILKNKKATAFDSLCLTINQAIYTGKKVEVDGNIITASFSDQAENFAAAVLSAIENKK
jgi:putative intracellular protease/amidase